MTRTEALGALGELDRKLNTALVVGESDATVWLLYTKVRQLAAAYPDITLADVHLTTGNKSTCRAAKVERPSTARHANNGERTR
jgi:hypothetical protein